MGFSDDEWEIVVDELRSAGLLEPYNPRFPDRIGAHALVTRYFASKMEADDQRPYKVARERLLVELEGRIERSIAIGMARGHGRRHS